VVPMRVLNEYVCNVPIIITEEYKLAAQAED
jgi:hypothetical protein